MQLKKKNDQENDIEYQGKQLNNNLIQLKNKN